MFRLESSGAGFSLYLEDVLIIEHSSTDPAVCLGIGREKIEMYRGNFTIEDSVEAAIPLELRRICEGEIILSHPRLRGEYRLELREEDGLLLIRGRCEDERYNRLYLRLRAFPGEHVMGGGEQFSALDMRGRRFPIWTREQGVGRNKLTEITRLADQLDGGGGDYHTTFFPQPSFVSSRMYFALLENYCYSCLDFSREDCHLLELWSAELRLALGRGENYRELLGKLSGRLGRQPELPDWAMRGIWLGVQGGAERAMEVYNSCVAGGMDVSAVWIQDWEGKRITSFGKRLQWDWRWNRELYPGLDKLIARMPGTSWLAYINPYLVQGGELFAEAARQGYFVKNPEGTDYLFDFGEFDCGVVDLSMPRAFAWYKDVIKQNIIALGFKGWMADFGEYLPADAVCFGGGGMELHNRWPELWARCNREAVEESGLLGEAVFFMRAGAAGTQAQATLVWAGDQCVDWSEDDGLPSVITAALSLGMSGFGLHCSDAGGYTSLFHLKRDEELLLRWLEFACFTPVMRTHEGNRPDRCVQIYSSPEIIGAAARLSRIHTALFPYMKACVRENSLHGVPVMRPLFLDNPKDERAYDKNLYSYLLGEDVLVAPVVRPGETQRSLWLPQGTWVHLWTGKSYRGGELTVEAPMAFPPVFFRADSSYSRLFYSIGNM